MKKLLVLSVLAASLFIYACGGDEASSDNDSTTEESSGTTSGQPATDYDTARGQGKFKDVQISASLDAAMAAEGEKVYNVKCGSCHRLTEERLVGPGWKGVTQRNKPEWIMNFVTNTDEMLAKDPKAQSQLEICLVRMPNQNVSDEAARQLYEFMRQNDGVK
jgi:cytochrome c551/c552